MRKATHLHYAFFFCISLLWNYSTTAQYSKNQEYVQSKLHHYIHFNAPEKAYLQTDKDFYTNGETIWFKTYLVNGITHTSSNKSRVVYVELTDVNGKIIAQRKLFVEDRNVWGDIRIPSEIKEGKYSIRSYTKYMLNEENPVIFQKEIHIWQQPLSPDQKPKKERNKMVAKASKKMDSIPLKPSIRFFPEGGELVAGMDNVLGIKVTNGKGEGISLTGKIMKQNNDLVSVFKSYEFGLGRAHFKVEPNVAYHAEIQIGGKKEKYPIPMAVDKGYTLQVQPMGDHLKVRVATNIPNGLKGSLLVGHIRGNTFIRHFHKDEDDASYSIKLLTSKLDDGVAHFTLFDKNGDPVSERLVFVESPKNKLKLSLKTDKLDYGFRNKIALGIDILDTKGTPVEGDFSVSVTTANSTKNQPLTIKSWLLLDSDLGGTVENPNHFFDETTKGRKYKLDLLMLTHGWRRFAWKSFKTEGVSKTLPYKPEKGIMVTGTTTRFKNKYSPKKTFTTLNLISDNIVQTKDTTNAQGRFSFGPYFFRDSVQGILNTVSLPKNGKKVKDFSIQLDNAFPKIAMHSLPVKEDAPTIVINSQPYLDQSFQKKQADFEYDPKVTQLKEVTVKSKPKTKEERLNKALDERTWYGGVSRLNRIIPDSINWAISQNSIFELLRTVAGVQVLGSFPDQNVIIRGVGTINGNTAPLYLLDGIPVDAGFIQAIPVFDVLFIDVLKGPQAAIYGVRGGNGVIAVYTKTGENFDFGNRETPGVATKMIRGFHKIREFYAPDYSISEPEHKKPDYRTTLLWQPKLRLNEDNTSTIDFHSGDYPGNYVIRIEGISKNGVPVSAIRSFTVKEDIEL